MNMTVQKRLIKKLNKLINSKVRVRCNKMSREIRRLPYYKVQKGKRKFKRIFNQRRYQRRYQRRSNNKLSRYVRKQNIDELSVNDRRVVIESIQRDLQVHNKEEYIVQFCLITVVVITLLIIFICSF